MKTRLSALLLALLLLLPISGAFAAGGASAAENGSIAVRFAGLEGAAFRLYRVADVLPGGEFALSGDFAAYPVALDAPDAAAWRALAQTLAGYAARDGLAPLQTASTDSGGRAVFSGLADGVYLVAGERFRAGDTIYTPSPLLVFLPFADADGALSRAAEADCKYESETVPTPGTTVKRRALKVWRDGDGDGRPAFIEVQLLRDGRVFDTVRLREENNWSHTWTGLDADFAWSVVETAVPAGYTVRVERAGITFVLTNTRPEPEEPEEPETPGGRLPQTGSLWWPVPVLALAGLFLLLLGWGRRRADRGA